MSLYEAKWNVAENMKPTSGITCYYPPIIYSKVQQFQMKPFSADGWKHWWSHDDIAPSDTSFCTSEMLPTINMTVLSPPAQLTVFLPYDFPVCPD